MGPFNKKKDLPSEKGLGEGRYLAGSGMRNAFKTQMVKLLGIALTQKKSHL